VSVVCCQVEVSATAWSLVQRSPTDCGESECDREAWTMRRPRPPRGCPAIGKRKKTSAYIKLGHTNVSYVKLVQANGVFMKLVQANSTYTKLV
jgi:hypothetical protein